MTKLLKKHSIKTGMSPGTLVHVGSQKKDRVDIAAMLYDAETLEVYPQVSVEECPELLGKGMVAWFNVSGIHDIAIMETLGQIFSIHPLAMEDILNTEQRPKVDEMDDNLVVIIKMLYEEPDEDTIASEQVSLVLGKNYVVTFQENGQDVFDPVRQRLQKNAGRTRRSGPDYLAYALLDVIVDHYFVVLEGLGENIESVEAMFAEPNEDLIRHIYELKRELVFIRKQIWPIRDVISYLTRLESPLISESLMPFMRDLYDHAIQIADTIETYRDVSSGLADLSVSVMGNRMNKVMQLLTVIATIFIPLTFISSVYGMNFRYMPELNWHYGYFAVLLFMFILGVLMMRIFQRKKWL